MDNNKNNHNDILHTLTAENADLRGRIQDLETYIDGRKMRWDALAAKLLGEQQTVADLETAVRVRDARVAKSKSCVIVATTRCGRRPNRPAIPATKRRSFSALLTTSSPPCAMSRDA